MENTMVSIWCLTYNHEKYIRDALEGFLKQKTDFKFEVFVYDDASTDGTASILYEYKNRYPNIFTIYVSEHNRWKDPNRKEFLHRLKLDNLNSKYIACCEGDDYWTDENKLQTQVEYMETHPKCSMYIHNCLWLDCTDNSTRRGNPFDIVGEMDVSTEMLIEQKNGHPPMASFLFRKKLLLEDFFFFNSSAGDYPLLLCAASNGRVHYNNRAMSVYRWKSAGSYTDLMGGDDCLQFVFCIGLIDFLVKYNSYTDRKYEGTILKKVTGFVSSLLCVCMKNGRKVEEQYKKCLEQKHCLPPINMKLIPKLEEFAHYEQESYLSEATRKFIGHYKHIIIMGIGKYAQILTKQLDYYNIPYDGYGVSQPKDNESSFNGKPVWKLADIPYEKKEIGVIVGILINDKEDILTSLQRAGIENYCMPFEYNLFEE